MEKAGAIWRYKKQQIKRGRSTQRHQLSPGWGTSCWQSVCPWLRHWGSSDSSFSSAGWSSCTQDTLPHTHTHTHTGACQIKGNLNRKEPECVRRYHREHNNSCAKQPLMDRQREKERSPNSHSSLLSSISFSSLLRFMRPHLNTLSEQHACTAEKQHTHTAEKQHTHTAAVGELGSRRKENRFYVKKKRNIFLQPCKHFFRKVVNLIKLSTQKKEFEFLTFLKIIIFIIIIFLEPFPPKIGEKYFFK